MASYLKSANETWSDATCLHVSPNIFFHDDNDKGHDYGEAKAICSVCPIRKRCLDFALTHHIRDGVFGGLSPKERRGLYKERRPSRTLRNPGSAPVIPIVRLSRRGIVRLAQILEIKADELEGIRDA